MVLPNITTRAWHTNKNSHKTKDQISKAGLIIFTGLSVSLITIYTKSMPKTDKNFSLNRNKSD